MRLTIVLCCLGLCVFGLAAERYFMPAAGKMTIDGKADDWSKAAEPIVIDNEHLGGGWLDNTFAGPQDCQAVLRMAYDSVNFYAIITVTDNSVVPLMVKSKVPGKFWEQDGIGVYLDTPALNTLSGRYNTHPTRPWQQEPVLQLTPSYEKYGAETLPNGSQYACNISDTGYTVEASVPWASLGWQPQAGDRLFFCATLADYDKDANGKIGQLKQVVWHQAAGDVRPTARTWAEMRLLNREGFGSEVMAAPPVVTRGMPLNWKVMAEATQPGWMLKSVTLISPKQPTRSLIKGNAVSIAPGTPRELFGSFTTADLPSGVYTLQLTAVQGRVTQFSSQTVIVTEDKDTTLAATAPKLPTQYYLPDPLRGYRSADAYNFPHKPVTHADYLAFVKEEMESGWSGFDYHLKVRTLSLGGSWYQEYGLRVAAYAKVTNDPVWIKRAQDMFEMADASYKANNYTGLGWINFPLLYYYKSYLSAVNAWKANYDDIVCDWYMHIYPKFPDNYFYGMNNWGLANGIMGVAGNYWLGDKLPDAARWKVQVDNTWDKFIRDVKDIDENTTNYAVWDLWMVMNYLDMTGQTSLLKTDAKLRGLFERYMLETAPSGARPHYGATNGWHDSPAVFMYLFERVGQITGDGRYKYAARQMWDYSQRHLTEWHSYHLVFDQTLTYLTRLLADVPDDTMPAVPMDPKSVLTLRGKMHMWTPQERTEKHEFCETLPEQVPGKLILRSGNDPGAFYTLVELNNEAGHCPARPTSINSMMAKETVLLTSQAYMENDPYFHNMVYVEDLEATQPVQPPMDITVPVFQDTAPMTYAVAQVTNYLRYPITLKRHYFFAKDRFLWVRDELTFDASFFARIGPCWLSRQMNSSGKDWANTYIDLMPYTGLGQGGTFYWKNYNYDLLTYCVPRPGMALTMTDLTPKSPFMAAPLQLRQTWVGRTDKGKTLVFDSLLIPHGIRPRDAGAAWLADTIHPTVVNDGQTVLTFELPWHREKVLILTSGKPYSDGYITTDAAQAMIVWQGDKVTNWWARQATTLKVGDQVLVTSPTKVDKAQ